MIRIQSCVIFLLAVFLVLAVAVSPANAGPLYLIASGEKKAFFTHAGNASTHHGWESPTAILETLYAVFGKFDLDPCSPRRTRPPVKAKVITPPRTTASHSLGTESS